MFHTLGERRVHSLSFGTGAGTLVGIAGSFADCEIWVPTFELLSPQWRVVGFDHDGVRETKVRLATINHEHRMETPFSVLDVHKIDRCVLAGDSSNATLAIETVLSQPERFDGLIVVNGSACGFDRPAVHRFVAGLRNNFEKSLDFVVELVFPEPDSDHLKQWLRDIIVPTGPDAPACIVESYYQIDLRDRRGEIRVPTMIVHGVLDSIAESSLGDVHALAGAMPCAKLDLLEDAGHLPLKQSRSCWIAFSRRTPSTAARNRYGARPCRSRSTTCDVQPSRFRPRPKSLGGNFACRADSPL